MKNRINHLLNLGAFAAAIAFAGPALHAQDDEETTARAKFSDPGKAGTFKCIVPWAELRVTGTNDSEVVVISSLNQKGANSVDRDGFRRLDNELSFELQERDNVVTLSISGDNPWAANGAEFEVRVPRNTNLQLRTEAGGDIQVKDVEGDVEIKSSNGEVELSNVSNASVETMNGEITASFAKAPSKPVSLTSMNGEIDLRLPADTKANLRMRTQNGTIRTNFPESMLQARNESASRTHHEPGINVEAIRREALAAGRDGAEVAKEIAKIAREQARTDERRAREAVAQARSDARAEIATVTPVAPGSLTVPLAPRAPRPPRMPHFGGKTVAGELNGGGVDITLTSMNGTITLRQVK